jgi:hypothetical protein
MCRSKDVVESERREVIRESSNAGYIPTAYNLFLGKPGWREQVREEMEERFFASIRLKNGTYKFTYSHRLDDLNELTNKLLPPARPLKVMDVAISSGISTVEWTQSLMQAGISYQMTAGDSTINCCLVSVGRRLHVLVDGAGYPLQFDLGGKAVPNPPGKRTWTAYALPLTVLRCALAWHRRTIRRIALGIGEPHRRYGPALCPIELVISRLQAAPNLQIVEDNILTNNSFQSCFHVVRAANILNRSYFDDSTLIQMLLNLKKRLLTGGVLIVCRTTEQNDNRATVFLLGKDRKFSPIGRLGEGSDIEDLALALPGGPA